MDSTTGEQVQKENFCFSTRIFSRPIPVLSVCFHLSRVHLFQDATRCTQSAVYPGVGSRGTSPSKPNGVWTAANRPPSTTMTRSVGNSDRDGILLVFRYGAPAEPVIFSSELSPHTLFGWFARYCGITIASRPSFCGLPFIVSAQVDDMAPRKPSTAATTR